MMNLKVIRLYLLSPDINLVREIITIPILQITKRRLREVK